MSVSRSTRVAGAAAIATLVMLCAFIERGRTLRAERVLHELPHTASAVLRIDTRALAGSRSGRALFDWLVPEERLSEIEARCGLAPRVALSDATIWIGGPEGEPLQSIGLLLRGRTADSEVLAACYRTLVEARGSGIERVSTSTGPQLRSRDGRSALAQVDTQSVVTGSPHTVAAFMAVDQGAVAPLSEDANFMEAWSRVGVGAAIALVFVAPSRWQAAFERIGAISDQGSALAGVEVVTLTTVSENRSAIEVMLDIADADTAQRDAALMRVWMESPPDTVEPYQVDVARSAQITVEGSRITLILDPTSLPKPP